MKFILIKHHPSVQLAHLYEHLFVMHAKRILFEKGLYKGLDYWVSGKTFEQGGIIKVSIDLYSDTAKAIKDEILKILIDKADAAQISRALCQIVAEEPFELYIKDKKKLLDELGEIDNEQWLINEEAVLIDTKSIRLRNNYIYLTNEIQLAPRVLKTTISLDPEFAQENRILLPLFNLFSRWLIFTPDDVIADENGYYSGDIDGSAKNISVTGEILIAPFLSREVKLDDLFQRTREIMVKMCDANTLDKLAKDIKLSTNKDANPYSMPDLDRILKQTGVYIGYAELNRQASLENLLSLSQHCTLEMNYGRKRISERLV